MLQQHRQEDFENFAKILHDDGIVVIPFLTQTGCDDLNNEFWETCNQFPEYARRSTPANPVKRVQGGFGAFGNPSSYHHPTVRSWRKLIKDNISKPLFREYERQNGTNRKIEMMYDRMCERQRYNGSISAEKWHRDIYDRTLGPGLSALEENDEIFGGWLNMNEHGGPDRDQYFVGVKSTHKGPDYDLDVASVGGGFSVIPPNRHAYYRELCIEQTGKDRKGQPMGVQVPPGCIIIFPQRIGHSVKSGTQPDEPSVRLFTGHRLTNSDTPLFDLDEVFETQCVPRIPSGQLPPMYSSQHYAFIPNTMIPWSAEFKDVVLYDRTVASGKNEGLAYRTPGSKRAKLNAQRVMGSLEEFGMKFEEYSEEDKQVLKPEP